MQKSEGRYDFEKTSRRKIEKVPLVVWRSRTCEPQAFRPMQSWRAVTFAPKQDNSSAKLNKNEREESWKKEEGLLSICSSLVSRNVSVSLSIFPSFHQINRSDWVFFCVYFAEMIISWHFMHVISCRPTKKINDVLNNYVLYIHFWLFEKKN